MDEDAGRAQAEAAFGAPSAGTASRGGAPSRTGYAIGVAVIALGVVAAVAWFVVQITGFADRVDDLGRVAVPGSGVVALEEGRQAIYYEGPGGEDAVVPPLRVRIVPVGGGAPLEVGPHSGSVSYSVGGHAGRSLFGFRAPRDGRYRVTVATAAAPVSAQLAIGRGVGGRIVSAILGGFGILAAGGIAGTVIIVVTSTRRSRAAKAAAAAA